MSASSVPIPLDQFEIALTSLEVPLLHQESSRLQNSLYHLDRSNSTLAEYPDDEDCRDAIRHNLEVIDQQKQRIELIRLELRRRGVSVEHMDLNNPTPDNTTQAAVADPQAPRPSAAGNTPGSVATVSTNGTPANGYVEEDEAGVYL
ncbi:hypothetical protein ABW19_dt0208663 [Dactylella cylindrospora]|nr:hypothetical protein ABW19_dt0208663 [Dactylella cylindrospora]